MLVMIDKLTNFMRIVIVQRMRMNRGLAWISYFIAPVSTIVGVLYNSVAAGFLVIIGFFIAGLILGFIEQKYLKSWHYENEYNVKELNPYFEARFAELEKKLDEIALMMQKK